MTSTCRQGMLLEMRMQGWLGELLLLLRLLQRGMLLLLLLLQMLKLLMLLQQILQGLSLPLSLLLMQRVLLLMLRRQHVLLLMLLQQHVWLLVLWVRPVGLMTTLECSEQSRRCLLHLELHVQVISFAMMTHRVCCWSKAIPDMGWSITKDIAMSLFMVRTWTRCC